jgi:lysophospholipase L1-like esterase
MAKSVLLIGHSFLTHLQKDIKYGLIGSNNFGLNSSNQAIVFFAASGGMRAYHLNSQLSFVSDVAPEVIVIDIGTNDIDGGMLPQDVAQQIKTFVYDIIRIPAVKKVVILQVLFRERHGSRCPEFNQRVTELNTILKRFALDKKDVVYWKHRGLWQAWKSTLRSDGVHLNLRGEHLYYRSIRGAILHSLNHFEQ